MRAREPFLLRRFLHRGALVAAVTAVVFVYGSAIFVLDGWVGYDYELGTRPAAERVLAGDSPYPSPREIASSNEHTTYLYPPPLAFLAVPTLAVNPDAARRLVALIGVVLIVASLVVVRVRDPWCYVTVFVWAPTANGVQNANVTLILMFALALVWRWRDHTRRAGVALAAAVGLKLFLTPLLLWPIARRRLGLAATAVVSAAVMVGGSWAAIGFAGLTSYPELLSRASERWSEKSDSFLSVADSLGFPDGVGRGLALAIGLTLAAFACRLASNGDAFRSFVLLVASALVMTPIAWQHYVLLLAVPLAVARPQMSAEWLLPVVLWFTPMFGAHGPLIVVALSALLVVAVVSNGRSRTPSRASFGGGSMRPSRALVETAE